MLQKYNLKLCKQSPLPAFIVFINDHSVSFLLLNKNALDM